MNEGRERWKEGRWGGRRDGGRERWKEGGREGGKGGKGGKEVNKENEGVDCSQRNG